MVIPKNEENNTLIINNLNMNKIQYNINFCKSPHDITMFYHSGTSLDEESFEFNSEKTEEDQNINKNPFRLRFESNEDFIFSYSFIDREDELVYINDLDWIYERDELVYLIIEEVNINNIINKVSNVISIKFYPNYKYSPTRYIIVIAPKYGNYKEENFSNPCFITRLVTEKVEGIQIVNVVDTGENDFIHVDVDISNLLIDKNNKFIINIISQELRF